MSVNVGCGGCCWGHGVSRCKEIPCRGIRQRHFWGVRLPRPKYMVDKYVSFLAMLGTQPDAATVDLHTVGWLLDVLYTS